MVAAHTIFGLFLFEVFLQINAIQNQQGTPAPQDVWDITLVLVGMRHGNRNPDTFLKTDPNKGLWGKEGSLQLTNYGKNQAYGLGKALRSRYNRLLPQQFSHKEVKTHSSSAERCQMTMQTFLAGLYPPAGDSIWNPALQWQPIPVAINNPLLRMYSVKGCQTSDDSWAPIDDDSLPELSGWLSRDKMVVDYVTQNEGIEASLASMADVADNLHNLHILNLSYPTWLEYPRLPGYTKQSLFDKIMTFAEAHQIACAKYGPCRNIMGGTWAEHITKTLKDKRDGKSEELKIVPYASHTEITLCIMKMMGMDYDAVETSSGFILEYKNSPYPSVRLLFHEADTENPQERHIFLGKMTPSAACREGWCDLNTFLLGLEPQTIEDWETACRVPEKTCPALNQQGIGINPSGAANSGLNCATERDTSPESSCELWARRGLCQDNLGVRYLFCRYTCGCLGTNGLG